MASEVWSKTPPSEAGWYYSRERYAGEPWSPTGILYYEPGMESLSDEVEYSPRIPSPEALAAMEEAKVEWRCDNCGNAYPDGPGTWRHGYHGPEHACEGRHPQAGHSPATYVGSDVTRSAIAQLKADLERTCTDLSLALARLDAATGEDG